MKSRNLRNLKATTQMPIWITVSTNEKENGDSVLMPKSKIKSGLEADEEKESHYKEAVKSQSSALKGGTVSRKSIPIPGVEILELSDADNYHHLQHRKNILRTNHALNNGEMGYLKEDCYDLDEEDAEWLSKIVRQWNISISNADFEKAIEVLENNSRKTVLPFDAYCEMVKSIGSPGLVLIYDYWLVKRTKLCSIFPAGSLIPIIQSDDYGDEENPYVAFRKRELDRRRRSTRKAFNSMDLNSAHQKTEEEFAVERAEHIGRLNYKIDFNSELDGDYNFNRDKRCTYRSAGTINFI